MAQKRKKKKNVESDKSSDEREDSDFKPPAKVSHLML